MDHRSSPTTAYNQQLFSAAFSRQPEDATLDQILQLARTVSS